MPSESRKEEVADVHVEMWKHYDNLRQQKNGSFLTGNAILAAIAGFTVKDAPNLAWALPIVGIIIAIAWFLLLTQRLSIGELSIEYAFLPALPLRDCRQINQNRPVE